MSRYRQSEQHLYPTLSKERSFLAEKMRMRLLQAGVLVLPQQFDHTLQMPQTISMGSYLPRREDIAFLLKTLQLKGDSFLEIVLAIMIEVNEFLLDQAHVLSRGGTPTVLTSQYAEFANAAQFINLVGGRSTIKTVLQGYFSPYDNGITQADQLFQRVEEHCVRQNKLCKTMSTRLAPNLTACERSLFLFSIYMHDEKILHESPFFLHSFADFISLVLSGIDSRVSLGSYNPKSNTVDTLVDRRFAILRRKNAVINGILLGLAPMGLPGALAGIIAILRSSLFLTNAHAYFKDTIENKDQIVEHELLHFLSASQGKEEIDGHSRVVVKIGSLYLRS